MKIKTDSILMEKILKSEIKEVELKNKFVISFDLLEEITGYDKTDNTMPEFMKTRADIMTMISKPNSKVIEDQGIHKKDITILLCTFQGYTMYFTNIKEFDNCYMPFEQGEEKLTGTTVDVVKFIKLTYIEEPIESIKMIKAEVDTRKEYVKSLLKPVFIDVNSQQPLTKHEKEELDRFAEELKTISKDDSITLFR